MTDPVFTTDDRISPCVDLKATFGNRYRYEFDEAYEEERPDLRFVEAPWLTTIRCKFVTIVPWGGRKLAAYCNAGPVKRNQLHALTCAQVVHGGGEGQEVVVVFDIVNFDQVAAVMKPRIRRRASPETRAARAAHLARVRPCRGRSGSTVKGGLPGGQEASPQGGVGEGSGDTVVGPN